jgi:hypothetical protein
MNDEMTPMDEMQESLKQRRVRFPRRKKERVSSRFGYATFVLTAGMIALGIVVSGGLDHESGAQAVTPPVDALNISALSASWSCPIAGNPAEGDSLLITNSDAERTTQVTISAHTPAGEEAGRLDVDIEPQTTREVALSQVTTNAETSLFVESFNGAVSVFRSLTLSDGQEFVRCDSTTTQSAQLVGISSLRGTNAAVVLANPYDQAVVVDMTATLVDTSIEPARTVLDEKRGIIVPARGRTTIDVQAEFGRYSLVNISVKSRSGFFSAEARQSYSLPGEASGETIITAASDLTDASESFVPGMAPTRIAVLNGDSRTHSVTLEAFATDKRFVTSEPQLVGAASSSLLTVPGDDFGVRTISFAVERAERPPENMFVAWSRAAVRSVSSGDGVARSSENFVVPAVAGDTLYIFNSSDEETDVTLAYSTIPATKTITVAPRTYLAVELDLDVADVNSIVSIASDKRIYIGMSDETLTRFTSGINVIS